MKLLKHPALALLTFLLPLVSHAQSASVRMDIPIVLNDSIRSALPDAGAIVGVYKSSKHEMEADLARLKGDDSALDDQLQALVVNLPQGQFHLSNRELVTSLVEETLSFTRSARALNMENACIDWPKKGDVLKAQYAATGWQTSLVATVDTHVPYMRRDGRLEEVRPGDQKTCAAEEGSQTYYRGQLSVTYDGKVVSSSPVVVYNLQLP